MDVFWRINDLTDEIGCKKLLYQIYKTSMRGYSNRYGEYVKIGTPQTSSTNHTFNQVTTNNLQYENHHQENQPYYQTGITTVKSRAIKEPEPAKPY